MTSHQTTPAPATEPGKRPASDAQLTFAELGVPAALAAVLKRQGKSRAFPIQAKTLPDTLRGRDVLGRGKTGSGKTIAFSLPLVAALTGRRARAGRPIGLVLAPTRELATQIEEVIAPLAHAAKLRVTTVFGGVKPRQQIDALQGGVDIVVACPGRLEDLIRQGHVHLDGIAVTVIDEADHMADLGFLPSVTRILSQTPERGQRLLFSATLDNGIDVLANRFLHDPVLHSIDEANSPVPKMTHHVFEVPSADEKKAVVQALASGEGRRILFMRTKHHAKRLAKQLTAAGIPAVDLQGNLSQAARERNLAAFESNRVHVLVATDVAARGIDVPEVELVVHVDPPAEHKAYLHRSGRTARAGHEGDVVTLSLPEQRRDIRTLLGQAKITVTPTRVTAASEEVAELTGTVAPYVEPKATEQDVPSTGRGRSRRGPGGQGRGGRSRSAQGRPQAEESDARQNNHSSGERRQTKTTSSGSARRSQQRDHGQHKSESQTQERRASRTGRSSSRGSSNAKRSGSGSGAAQGSHRSGVGQPAGARGRGTRRSSGRS